MSKKESEYKAYFFGNMYISQIAHGIQASHVLGDMFVKYRKTGTKENIKLYEWAENHKTMMLKNGGYQSTLLKIYVILEQVSRIHRLPFAKFHEEQDALNGALTSVGVIVPMDLVSEWWNNEDVKLLTIDSMYEDLIEHGINKDIEYTESAILLTALLRSCKFA